MDGSDPSKWKSKNKKEKVVEEEEEVREKKPWTENAEAKILFTNVDDLDTGQLRSLKDVEAGSSIHGMVEVRLPQLPINVTACAKFVLKGRFLEHGRKKKKGEGDSYSTKEERKFLVDKTRMRLHPRQPLPSEPNGEEQFLIVYPFAYQLKEWLCGTFELKSGKEARNIYAKYELHVKIKYASSHVRVKSPPRPIEIVSKRPTLEELTAPPLVSMNDSVVWLGSDPAGAGSRSTNGEEMESGKKEKRKWKKDKKVSIRDPISAEALQAVGTPGNGDEDFAEDEKPVVKKEKIKNKRFLSNDDVEVKFGTMHQKYLEGTCVVYVLDIRNKSKSNIETAEIQFKQKVQYPIVPKGFIGEQKPHKWTNLLSTKKLRALTVAAESHRVLFVPMMLPPLVEPPTTYFEFDHQRIFVEFMAVFKFNIFNGPSYKAKTPVFVCANPERFTRTSPLATPPSFRPYANYPPKYQVVTKVPPPPRWEFKPPRVLSIELVRAKGLPKMDSSFFGGKADPYVTMWVNKSFVQTSSVKTNTLNPVWNEVFHFPILTSLGQAEEELEDGGYGPIEVLFRVYDWDKSSSDDEIGSISLLVEPRMQGNQELELVLKRQKKKKEQTRGKLYVKILSA